MAEKKAGVTTKPAGKAPTKSAATKKITRGDSYVCGVCGLAVTVEEVGNIALVAESPIICCGEVMKKQKGKARVKKTR